MIMNQPARQVKAFLHNKFFAYGRLLFVFLMFSFSESVVAQQPVTGKVTGNSSPLSGVTVQVKGNTVSTQTDADGSFAIPASPNATLVFTYIGYATKEVPVSNRVVIDVELEAVTRQLDQVVVTGYTRQAKKDITGSVAVVDVAALKSIPAGSAEQALQGQASGVVVINSGVPGGTSNIFIRGVSSFGDTQPLVIVDGVQSSLHDVNSNDTESIQVLKDAGAASIYGVRGSNGVIIVTTKKGKRGAPTFSYDFYYGTQVPPSGNVLNIASPEAYAAFVKKMNPGTQLFPDGTLPDYLYAGPGVKGIGNEGDPAVDPSKYVFDAANPSNDYLIQRVNKQGTDWFHQIFRAAPTQNHSLTMSGGTDKSNYLFSVGYLNQQGTLLDTYLKRYSARINTEFKIKKWFRVGENVYAFYKQNPVFSNQDQDNAIFFAYTMPNFIPVYDINGQYGGTWAGPGELGNRWNPVAMLKNTAKNKNNAWDIVGNMYAELDILNHLTAKTVFGGTVDNQYSYNFTPNRYQDLEQHTGKNSYNENSLYNSNWIWTNTLTYNQIFGNHNVKLLAGSEAINNYGRGVGGSATGFFSTDLNYLVLNNGTSDVSNYSNAYTNTLYSLFARLDYSFNDRYLIAATVRRDGSSKFGETRRFGVFPSFSAGWRISKEKFMEKLFWLNDLKIRGSWGKLGSQNNVPSANAFSLFNSGFGTSYYGISGSGETTQGFYQSNIGNPYTGWEEDEVTNLGLDATIFNKIDISVEWYKKSINGLLFPQPLPATAGGASAPIINIGDVQNKGWDLSLTYHGKAGRDFRFDVSAIVTAYKNLVVKIPDPGYFDVGLVRNQQGYPVSSFFGYDVIGFFNDSAEIKNAPTQQDAAPGRFRYRDVDGDGKITTSDRTFIGNPNPKFTYGLNLNASYRNFDFSMILYGSQGNDVYNSLRSTITHWNGFPQALSNDLVFHSWTPENHDAKAPIAENSSNFSSGGGSFYVENGSFLKCRSMILGYTLAPAILEKLGINKFRVYVQAANLFCITKYSGLDPELQGSSQAFGIDNSNYPNNFKNYNIGINLQF
jgi:TonB-linked SusC/RagA family outer membrane protein